MKTQFLTRFTALAVALAVVSGCQTIPKAKTEPLVAQPNLPIDRPFDTLDNNTVSRENLASIANQRWQDFYTDPKLKQLIATGLENNKDIGAAVLAIQRARAQYQISDIANVPTIGATGSRNRSGDFSGNAVNGYKVGLASSAYELDFWGKVTSEREAALQSYLASGANKDTAQISLISAIAESYVAYSYNLAQLQLAEHTRDVRKEALRINKLRFQAGLDSELSFVQAQTALESANLAIANAKTSAQQNLNALRFLVGVPVSNNLLPKSSIDTITNTKIFSTGLPSDLLRYRPDIRAAEYQLKAAGANIDVARAAFYPTISLSGNIGASSTSLGNLFKTGAMAWGIGPSVSLPIFDAGARKANYEISEIAQQQALNNYEKSIQTAFKEVADVFATRMTLAEQQRAYASMLEASNKNYNIANARFKAGLDNYLGVLDAQKSQFESQQSLLNIRQKQLNSQIELYKALGGGVNFDVPLDLPRTVPHENLSDKISRGVNNVQEKLAHSEPVVPPVPAHTP